MRKNHALDNVQGPELEHIINVFEQDPVSVDELLEDSTLTEEQCKIVRNILFK